MKKIIPALSVLVITGCSTAPIQTTEIVRPVSISIPSAPHLEARQALKFSSPFRHHSILQPSYKNELHDINPSNTLAKTLSPRFANYLKTGVASWYGKKFHGRKTATGERFDMYAMTAAHKTLPIPSYAQVTNLENHRSVIVKINDRGPFVGNRLLDLSYAAAKKLDMDREGTGKVEIRAISPDQVLAMNKNTTEEEFQPAD
ncbi:MAG: septal ring lytic transglycosylase RlpA family protein [Methylococcaceae bacterium]